MGKLLKQGAFILVLATMVAACSGLDQQYTIKTAKEQGDVVSYNEGRKLANLANFIAFVDDVKQGNQAKVRVATFSQKRGNFVDVLSFDGGQVQWAHKLSPSDEGKAVPCDKIVISQTRAFILKGCKDIKPDITILRASPYFFRQAEMAYEKR